MTGILLAEVMIRGTAAKGPVPSTFDGAADTVAVLVLLLEFGMLRAAFLREQVRLYAAQSIAVSALSVVVAVGRDVPELYVLAGLSVVLKAVVVPVVIVRLMRNTSAEIAGSGALGVASEVLAATLAAAVGFFVVDGLGIHSDVLPTTALSLSFSVVLVAFMIMILRRDVISQGVGFFSLENGVSLASLVVAAGMPLILEVAFLFDLLVAVVVFGILMRVHHERNLSLSTEPLTRLRG